jgi:hypothetical protein
MSRGKRFFFSAKHIDRICGSSVQEALSTEKNWLGFEADHSLLHLVPRLRMFSWHAQE